MSEELKHIGDTEASDRVTPSQGELIEDDIENVAGGATSCTPDVPTIIPPDDFFTPLDPTP